MATRHKKLPPARSRFPQRRRELIPYNQERCDRALALLARQHKRSLTLDAIDKLHVMMDVFHVLFHGKPIVGGSLFRWNRGIVNDKTYTRFRGSAGEWETHGTQPDHFKIIGKQSEEFFFEPAIEVDESDFSQSELQAMAQAWTSAMEAGAASADSDEFFRSSETFMGRAYMKAGKQNQPIKWEHIIDAYSELHPEYKIGEHVKVLVSI